MYYELISVVMGIRYHRTELTLLRRSIDSILHQSYENLELLICEFDSSIEAKNCLADYAKQDYRIRLIDGDGAETLAKKLDRCISGAKGEYIARMDDDDYSEPDRLQRQLSYMKSHPKISFVGCSVGLERDGQPAGHRTFPELPEVKDFLLVQPFIHPALFFRKAALDDVGVYCEAQWCVGCEDYELLLRMYERGYKGANLREELLRYTLPSVGKSNRTMRMRFNEVRTRFTRFQSLGLLPQKMPYVIKPIIVGLIPQRLLESQKRKRWKSAGY